MDWKAAGTGETLAFKADERRVVNLGRDGKGIARAAMRLVNHSSELIHQVYQREKVEDVAQWRDAVQFPAVTTHQE